VQFSQSEVLNDNDCPLSQMQTDPMIKPKAIFKLISDFDNISSFFDPATHHQQLTTVFLSKSRICYTFGTIVSRETFLSKKSLHNGIFILIKDKFHELFNKNRRQILTTNHEFLKSFDDFKKSKTYFDFESHPAKFICEFYKN
jgi:hypothetical protein